MGAAGELAVSAESGDPASYLARTAAALHAGATKVTATGVHNAASTGRATFHATLTIKGLGDFAYDGSLRLTKVRTVGWRVEFDESSVYPGRRAGSG